MSKKNDIEESWKIVKDDLLREDGLLDWDKLKEMIHNYHILEEEVSKVYMTITGGKLSDINYHSHDVIAIYEDEVNKMFIENPRYIDLDFTESEDWIEWTLKEIEKGEEVSEDEKLIVDYHMALYNFIENHKLILSSLEEIEKASSLEEAKFIAKNTIEVQNMDDDY